MAWNEPGKNDRPPNDRGSRSPDTPPDLDEVLRQLQNKLKNLWSKRKPMGEKSGSTPSPSTNNKDYSGAILSFVGIVIVVLWVLGGLFIVGPSEKAAIVRFGKYVGTEGPGLHWIPPLIESKYVVNVQQVLTYPYQAEMLTQDENIVSVDVVVQYRINDLRNYLFNVANPNESLQQATASALRQVIGQTKLDDILTSGRELVREKTTTVLENTLQRYHTGLLVMDVNMQPAKPPEQVTAAFDDAIKAREDEQRFKNQAVSYANQVVPIAQGNAARLLAEAKAYQQQVILKAQGATAQYLALLPQYQQAPGVTRERMYLETLQSVLSHTPKILVDTPQSNNMMYLPLEQLLRKNREDASEKSIGTTIPLALPEEASGSITTPTIAQTTGSTENTAFEGRPGYDIPAAPSSATPGGQ